MSKAILIVGAGLGQVPAIERSKDLNFTVITVDKELSAPGMDIADHSYAVDVIDKEGVLDIATKHNINGIMTLQSDFGVPAVGYVNDRLGLRGVNYEVASRCSNKMETRKRLYAKNCPQPEFYFVSNYDEALVACYTIGFPCIIKAPDSSASRGIIKVTGEENIRSAIDIAFSHTNKKQVIVEEFIVGTEFGAQTFSIDGRCQTVLLHNDTLSPPPSMVPIGHSLPFSTLDAHFQKQVIVDIKNAVNALGIENGPANVDLIYDKRNCRVKILEIGARIGATCLPELVQYHTGIDWIKETIKTTIGEKPNLQVKKEEPVAALIIDSPACGTFEGYELIADPVDYKVIEFEISAKSGDTVNTLRFGTDRIGKVITTGESDKSAEKNAREFKNNIKIFVN